MMCHCALMSNHFHFGFLLPSTGRRQQGVVSRRHNWAIGIQSSKRLLAGTGHDYSSVGVGHSLQPSCA